MTPRFWRGLAACLLAAAACSASAQPYPAKPIRVVVPFAIGSGTDLLTRMVTDEMGRILGTTFIVDNKPGASSQIAAEATASAPPDGYTVMMTTNTAHSANPHLFRKLRYDPLKDFTPIARINTFLFVLAVKADSPVKTPAELIAHVRANPGKFSYGYGNSTGQVAGAHFVKYGKIDAQPVPYKSTPPAMTDMSGGQIEFMFVDLAALQSFLKAGKLKMLGVQADVRSPLLPDLPPVGETVPGFTFTVWGGLVGPAGMPPAIVQTLHAAANRALATPAVREKMISMGLEPQPMSNEDFRRFTVEQHAAWGKSIRDAGIQPE
jgi:tripartite-type tricarboxylate transporter receptor subunit TctC